MFSMLVFINKVTVNIYFRGHWFGEIHPECWHLYIVTPPERCTVSRKKSFVRTKFSWKSGGSSISGGS